MKKIAFLVLLSIMSVGLAFSQNRSQVLADIRFTMEDFMADLNFINEDRLYFNRRLDNLAASFGSPEYFIRNGKKTVSFRNWFKNYCTHDIQGLEIEHSIDILEKTFRKVDEKKNSDKRYSFDVILKRQYFLNGRSYDFPEEKLNMTIVWQGENQYVLLVGLEGNMKQITANAINGTQKQEKQFYNSNGTVKKKQITYVTSDNKRKSDIVSQKKSNENPSKYFKKCRKEARKGGAEAQYELGNCYWDGYGTEVDKQKAVEWWTKAAEQGYAQAQYLIGLCYANGSVV